jgi:hypothetical protein
VTIGDGAYIGSGSVITKPVEADHACDRARPTGRQGRLGEGVPSPAQKGVMRAKSGAWLCWITFSSTDVDDRTMASN